MRNDLGNFHIGYLHSSYYLIFQTRVGVLPPIPKYNETSLKTTRSRVFLNELRGILKSEEEHLASV